MVENEHVRLAFRRILEQQPDIATGELTYLQRRVIREALAYRHKHLWGQRAAVRLFYAQCVHSATLIALIAVLSGLYVTTPAGAPFFAAQARGVRSPYWKGYPKGEAAATASCRPGFPGLPILDSPSRGLL